MLEEKVGELTVGDLTVTRQPHPVWWSQYHERMYRSKALTKHYLQYHCKKCIQCMVTLITIDNEQSLLLGEVHCRSQEKRGKSGTLGERQTNKSLTFVHVTHSQSSVPCIRIFGFLTAQMTLLKSRDYL